jgi:hypothetical protein
MREIMDPKIVLEQPLHARHHFGVAHRRSPMNDDNEQYSPEETARRADEAIRRALNTPPTPQKEMVGKVGAPNRGRPKRGSRPVDKGKDQT